MNEWQNRTDDDDDDGVENAHCIRSRLQSFYVMQ